MFTIDASVHVRALHPAEEGAESARCFLEQQRYRALAIVVPTLLLVELAAAVARALQDAAVAVQLAQATRALPGYTWIPLDEGLANQASQLAAQARLRGADAVYAAVAQRHGATLVTCDQQQGQRLQGHIPVATPEEALDMLVKVE